MAVSSKSTIHSQEQTKSNCVPTCILFSCSCSIYVLLCYCGGKRSITSMPDEQYETLIKLVKGKFHVPKKDRSKEQNNAVRKYYRAHGKYTVDKSSGCLLFGKCWVKLFDKTCQNLKPGGLNENVSIRLLQQLDYTILLNLFIAIFMLDGMQAVNDDNLFDAFATIRYFMNILDGLKVLRNSLHDTVVNNNYEKLKGAGVRAVDGAVKRKYVGTSVKTVIATLSRNPTCQLLNAKFSNRAPHIPVTASHVMSRLQIDLIDKTRDPSRRGGITYR